MTGGAAGGLLLTAGLLAATGFLVSGLFICRPLRCPGTEKGHRPLYAADLIGGCLGAILGSLALIPIFGLAGTLKGMILLAALGILLI